MADISRKALEKELLDYITKFTILKNDMDKFSNRYRSFMEEVESEIIRLMDVLNIDEFASVKKELYYKDKTLSIGQLKKTFNDPDMIDHVVVTVSLPLTAENLRIKHGFHKDIIHEYIKLLNDDVRVVQTGLVIKK